MLSTPPRNITGFSLSDNLSRLHRILQKIKASVGTGDPQGEIKGLMESIEGLFFKKEKDIMGMKEELLSAREDNLQLRLRIWELEKKLDLSKTGEKKSNVEDVDQRVAETMGIVTKIEKWVRRRFHKTAFFIEQFRTVGFNDIIAKSLMKKLKIWAQSKPWRNTPLTEEIEDSLRETSTPFSHYSSFYSNGEKRRGSMLVHRDFVDDTMELAFPQNPCLKSDNTGVISKSCFSRSLSALERAKKLFTKAGVEDEERPANLKDVMISDLKGKTSWDARDVGFV
jgi:regulator of replication initiation timing